MKLKQNVAESPEKSSVRVHQIIAKLNNVCVNSSEASFLHPARVAAEPTRLPHAGPKAFD